MHWKNYPAGYGLVSKLLHWSVALLMIFLIWLGWYMVRLDYYHAWYYASFLVHQWAGLLVWLAGLLMVAWRFCTPAPETHLRVPERVLSRIVHNLLLFAVLFLPLTGLMVILSDGNTLTIGEFEIPLVVHVSSSIREWAVSAHYYVAYGCGFLAVLHVLAALKHHFVNRDNTLRRMLW